MTEGEVELATLSKFNSSSHPTFCTTSTGISYKVRRSPLHPRQALPRKDEYILPAQVAKPNSEFV